RNSGPFRPRDARPPAVPSVPGDLMYSPESTRRAAMARGACVYRPHRDAPISYGCTSEEGLSMIVGSGNFKYRVNADWAKLPDGWSFKEVGGVGVDSHDNVYVFNRGVHPMMVFDREGNFLRSWGEGRYLRAHGVHIAPDDTIFLTDDGGHFVRKVTLDGKILLELGVPGKPAPFMSGEPFHRCTHTALSPRGEIYISDGYGNARVHKYLPDGKLLMSWGEPGTGEGEFNIVHLGPRVSIVDHTGKLIGRFGDAPAGAELGKFLAPHGLAVDSRGDIYV